MTKTEARERLNLMFQACSFTDDRCDGECGTCDKAIDKAISALKAEQEDYCEYINDIPLPMFTESTEAYKEWTGENMGEQVTGKLKNPCDSLLTEDSEDFKEQKSKLEPSDDFARGYNEAKREIALSGEYERCYRRGYDDGMKVARKEETNTTVSGDLINRAEAIEAVLSLPMPLRLADEIDETLRSLPSADRPSGEWLEIDMDLTGYYFQGYYCSECHHVYRIKCNYCPSCGAKMGGAE